MPKRTEKLTTWDQLAIEAALVAYLEKGKLHTEHGRKLLQKIRRAAGITLKFSS